MHCSLLVFLLRFFQALYLTAIMGRPDKKKKKRDDCRNASLLRFRNCGVVTRFFSIDMRHRIASVLFFGSPVLLVNFR